MPAPYRPFHPVPLARMGLGMLVTGWTLAAVRRDRWVRAAVQAWAGRMLSALGVELRLSSPIPPGGQLWVSNHLSWVDPLLFLSLRPSRVMAKAEVAGYPGLGAGAARFVRFVKRESLFGRAIALRRLAQDLKAGEDFLLFPEGTTTPGQSLAPLQEGGLRMAYRLGVKVLPLRIDCADPHYPWVGDAALLPHLKHLASTPSTRVSIRPGGVLDPLQHPDEACWLGAIRGQLETPFLPVREFHEH